MSLRKESTPEAWVPKKSPTRQGLDTLHSEMEQAEVMGSPEKKAIDDFIGNIDNMPILKKIGLSSEPVKKFMEMMKEWTKKVPGLDTGISEYFGSILSAVGLDFLIPKKKDEKTDENKTKKAKKDTKTDKTKKDAEAEEDKETADNKPAESQDVLETPGSTLFMGDSLTVGMTSASKDILEINGPVETVAKKGRSSAWGLRKAKELAEQDPSPLKNYENAVVLFGSNDLLAEDPQMVISNLEGIYRTLKEAGVKNIYAVTIPPVKGYGPYDENPRANENRKVFNEWIKTTTDKGLTHRVIDLCKTESEGGLANNDDPDKLGRGAGSGDGLHFNKQKLGAIYQRELQAGTNQYA